MLTIGQMARSQGVTTKTLRHYDSIGLFSPCLSGQDNGYRYYRPEQIVTLGRIVWLRQLGMALDEIKALAASGGLDSVEKMHASLQNHAAQLEADINRRQKTLDHLYRYLAQPERKMPELQKPERVFFAAQRIIGMCWYPENEGSIAQMWDRFEAREHEIERLNEPVGTFGICQPLEDGQWRYIAGLPVGADATIPEGLVAMEIPGRYYAKVEHQGEVTTLPETFRAAYSEWLPSAGMQPDEGPEFEYSGARFLGPMNPESVTEIYIPLK